MLGLHTLNARDNSLIHWIFFEHSKGDPRAFQREMQVEAKQLRELLSSRGVKYKSLKSALVPTTDGIQAVFLYDWLEHPSWNYAVSFAHAYLPCLRDTLRTSVLHGDLHSLSGNVPSTALEAVLVSPTSQPVNWQTQYAVYFSNLRPADVVGLHESLFDDPRYTGYIDVSYSSPARDYISQTVAQHWVIHDRKILMSHGGDDPLIDAVDPVGYDLPSFGYDVVSLIDTFFTGFMSYKIEATKTFQSADDRVLSLAAATGEIIDVASTDVYVDPNKVDKYLLLEKDKLRLMTSIGLQDVTAEELGALVKSKLLQNYIYDFRYASEGTPGFAVAAEFEKPDGGLTRRLLALKHDKVRCTISLVSMY